MKFPCGHCGRQLRNPYAFPEVRAVIYLVVCIECPDCKTATVVTMPNKKRLKRFTDMVGVDVLASQSETH